MCRKLAKIVLIAAIAFQFQGCAITATTVLAASATGVAVAEDVFSIATKYQQFKREWKNNNKEGVANADANRTL